MPIPSSTIGLRDVAALYKDLLQSPEQASDIETQMITKPDDMDQSAFETALDELRALFIITVVVNGADGEKITGKDESIFTSVELPRRIDSIYIDSSIDYHVSRNFYPRNRFTILLDFSKPPLIDFTNPAVSAPTPNNSHFQVDGDNTIWVNGTSELIRRRFSECQNHRSWLHRGGIYDALLWLVGMPLAFFIIHRLSDFIVSLTNDQILKFAIFVYLFFLTLVLFRVCFGYTKWAWPKVEMSYKNNITLSHRKWWIFGFFPSLVVALVVMFFA